MFLAEEGAPTPPLSFPYMLLQMQAHTGRLSKTTNYSVEEVILPETLLSSLKTLLITPAGSRKILLVYIQSTTCACVELN